MIKNFKDRRIEALFLRLYTPHFPVSLARRAAKKLALLHYAMELGDLRTPPSNCLERLKGDREGQYSIRINLQWRICFHWLQGHAYRVEIIDYH